MKHISLLLTILFPAIVLAQEYQVYSVHGTVLSATDSQPVEMAAVQLFRISSPTDSAMVTGVQADLQGEYWLTSVPKGTYKLWVSSIGFHPAARTLTVSDNTTVPTIRLTEDVALLQEVQVKGKAAEMTVKGDTIEYNTAAYQVQENAMVEDLLKKMNGVEVDKEGKVTINGEEIKAVRIDGKKFFGDDVQSATKNIPADMIDKIQVIDEKSEMAKLTGFEDEDTERIINLTLKKDRKKGVFGNYTGGLGADMVTDNGHWFDYNRNFFNEDFRYTANAFTNLLLGESQTTIIASANNTNEIKTGRGRGMFGGSNAGITAGENLGVNTNIDLTDKVERKDSETEFLFGSNASVNHSVNKTQSESNKESYSGPLTYTDLSNDTSRTRSWDVSARFELEYQIDTLNKILLVPEISYTNSDKQQHQRYIYERDSTNAETQLINNGIQNRQSNSEDITAKVRLLYNHKFLKPGRSITMDVRANFTNTKELSDTYSFDSIRSLATVNQNSYTTGNSLNTNARLSWVEPIAGKNHFLETQIRFGTNLRNSDKDQYDFTDPARTQSHRNDSLSNQIHNIFFQEAISLSYRFIRERIDLTIGAQFNPSQTLSRTTYGNQIVDTTIYAWNWSPNLRFRYNFGKKEFARIRYHGRNQQPTIQQMVPVRNNSNAMNETVGNLALKPAFAHNLHAMYSKFEQEKFWSLMTGLHLTVTQDALVNNSIYDKSGKLYQQTVNAEGTPWNLWGDLMFNTPFANKLFQFNTRTSLGYQEQLMYILHEGDAKQIEEAISRNQFMLGAESKTGKLNIQENLSLRLTHDIVDLGVTGMVRYVRSENNLNASSLSNVIDWSVTGDVLFHLPKQWNIAADCGYTGRYGYNLDDVNEILLNASVDKSWGNATLSLKAYDLLHQKKNIIQTVGENSVSYQKTNALPTYFMLTFTYKFNKMGDLKASGDAAFMQEMIESGADPSKGKMPSGPPPFMR